MGCSREGGGQGCYPGRDDHFTAADHSNPLHSQRYGSLREATCPRSEPGRDHRALYSRETGRFLCLTCGLEADHSAFREEVKRRTRAFFDRFPTLASGDSEADLARLGDELLKCGVHPHHTLELVLVWNEMQARPPVPRERAVEILDEIAARLREGRAG